MESAPKSSDPISMDIPPSLSHSPIICHTVSRQEKPARKSTSENSKNKRQRRYNRRPSAMRKHSSLRRSSSAPPIGRRRRLLVEDHYRVDAETKSLLPGLPVNDDDDSRDLHDFFNLIALVPVVVLNVINWDLDILMDKTKPLKHAWTGQYFPLFFAITVGYFVADLIWVIQIPNCVKSPAVIVQHHIATLVYLIIPYMHPEETGWLMGACLIVEINTWLLIARRVFNKQGFGPWVIDLSFFSIRVKLISIFFYVTWIGIRNILYPVILKLLWELYLENKETHSKVCIVGLVLHCIFCVLNYKWTFDLFMSKWRAFKIGGKGKVEKGL